MSRLSRFFISLFAITISCIAFFSISIGDLLYRLNTTQLDMAGDGFKNYFTLSYQYKYGRGIHFDGFMYPYGDLATYADSQILIVWILQGLRSIGIDSDSWLLGIVNYLPLLSFVIAGLILVQIFEHYKIPYWYALLFSVVCIALSPQVFRVQSHYALAYAYVIPAVWWFNIKLDSESTNKYMLLIVACLFILAHGFIHPYLIFIISIFLLSLMIGKMLIEKKLSWQLLVQGLLPVISFLLIMSSLDPITDRPKNPYGLLIHKTEVSDLFPFYGWFNSVFKDVLNLRSDYTEGYASVGILIILIPVMLLTRKAFKGNKKLLKPLKVSKSLWSYFLAGILSLCFGMGLHIILTAGLILEIVPMLKQFRAMGRVSWVFYYTTFVFLSITFYRLIEAFDNKQLKWGVLGSLICLWSLDIYSYHTRLNKIVTTYKSDDLLNKSRLINDMLTAKDINPEKYQAVWVLPSSSEGTEKISFRDDWSSKMNAIPFAYQSGLPLTSIVMSRSSISNSLKVMQLSSSPYVEKEIVKDFKSNKPLLIILQNDRLEIFNDILQQANFIDKQKDFSLYEIEIEKLQEVKRFDSGMSLKSVDDVGSDGIFLDFENKKVQGLLSKGGNLINGSEDVFEIELGLIDTTEFSLSFWYKIQEDRSDVPNFKVQTFDKQKGLRDENHFRDWDMYRVEVIDNWIRLKQNYKLGPEDKFIKFNATGNYLHLDRVLFKPDTLNFSLPMTNPKFVQWNHSISQKEF